MDSGNVTRGRIGVKSLWKNWSQIFILDFQLFSITSDLQFNHRIPPFLEKRFQLSRKDLTPLDSIGFDAADDPHGALTSWTDQGIAFVDLLNQASPVPPEGFFVSLQCEDAGDDVALLQDVTGSCLSGKVSAGKRPQKRILTSLYLFITIHSPTMFSLGI